MPFSTLLSTATETATETATDAAVLEVTAEDLQVLIDTITAQINVATVIGVISIALGACVALAFMWWALRKLVVMIMNAFKRGKVSV